MTYSRHGIETEGALERVAAAKSELDAPATLFEFATDAAKRILALEAEVELLRQMVREGRAA